MKSIFNRRYVINILCITCVDLIKDIVDPEHPLSLEELHVVEENLIKVRFLFD